MKGLAETVQGGTGSPYPRQVIHEGGPSQEAAHSVEDWILEISRLWARGPAGTIELAVAMATAKSRLPYGAWSQIWKSEAIPFSKRKGEMLVVMGKNLAGADAQTFAHLPLGWSVLYQLSLLSRPHFHQWIQDATIHPKLTLGEAKKLVALVRGQSPAGKSYRANVKQRVGRFREFVAATLPDWSADEREWAVEELSGLVEQINSRERIAAPSRLPAVLTGARTAMSAYAACAAPKHAAKVVRAPIRRRLISH